MIQPRTVLKVCDNCGARDFRVITVIGNRSVGSVGDEVSGAVLGAAGRGSVSDHEVHRAVVVRTRKEKSRSDGSYIRFDDNACVLIDSNGKLLGNRIFGPVAREVREAGFTEIAGLAEELL